MKKNKPCDHKKIIKNPGKQIFFSQKGLWYPRLDPNFALANIIVKLMGRAFQNILLTFNHYIKTIGEFVF